MLTVKATVDSDPKIKMFRVVRQTCSSKVLSAFYRKYVTYIRYGLQNVKKPCEFKHLKQATVN